MPREGMNEAMMTSPDFIPDDALTKRLLCATLARMIKSSLTNEAKSCRIICRGPAGNQAGTAAADAQSGERRMQGT
jgi:hypothetical protein